MRRLRGWSRSLSVRLALAVIAAETALIVPLFLIQVSFIAPPGVLAEYVAFAPLQASIVKGPDGAAAIAPTDALRALMAANDTLRVAVVDPMTGRILPGSDERMASVLRAVRESGLDAQNFNGDRRATGAGDLLLITYAEKSVSSDLPPGILTNFYDDLNWTLPIGAAIAVPLIAVVWLTLRPVRDAARLAERLSLRTLDGRVPERRMPREVLGFVRSINGVLDRLDADVQRQRRFIANAAHELRTPISVLKARLDTLPDMPLKAELMGDSERIVGLVRQLMTIARLGDTALPVDQDIEMVAAVRDIVADYAPVAIDRGRDLGFSSAEVAVTIRGNLQAFQSAVFNVIDNALRAEPVGGTVDVVVGPGPRVSVADHGPGIHADDTIKLFEPFWRKDHSVPGTGLGLPIVHECMRLHRGAVEVDSQPGKGATFRLDFAPREEGQSVRG